MLTLNAGVIAKKPKLQSGTRVVTRGGRGTGSSDRRTESAILSLEHGKITNQIL